MDKKIRPVSDRSFSMKQGLSRCDPETREQPKAGGRFTEDQASSGVLGLGPVDGGSFLEPRPHLWTKRDVGGNCPHLFRPRVGVQGRVTRLEKGLQ